MGHGWSIRVYKNGDEEGIYELDRSVHGEIQGKDQWLKWWHWKYRHNPAGAFLIWLAEADGKLVSQYAINGVKIKIGDEIITGSQSVDTMTHPHYRGKGIFSTLSRQVFSDAGERGIDIVYGFPNQMTSWHRECWLEVGARSTMIKPLNPENILAQYISNKFLLKICIAAMSFVIKALYRTQKPPEANGLTINRISAFDERINDLWEKVSDDYEIIVVRDKEYLNWRYIDIPSVDYAIYVAETEGQIMGYTVLRCEKQRGLLFGHIFEFVVPSGYELIAQSLILKAVDFFREEKADLVLYRMIADRTVFKTVRKSGFISLPFMGSKLRFVTRANTPKISEAFIRNRRNWFVQTGDSDAV